MSLKKNDDIKIKIESMTAQGSGVGKYDGMAVFVAGTAVGDEIIAHIIKAKKTYAVATVKEIIVPSADRTEPDCPVFNKCGGCVYRHISYEAEKEIKKQKVCDALSRIGHIDIEVDPIIGADETSHYRNKAQYPVGFDNGIKIGFYAPHSHRIIDCRACRLQPAVFETILGVFDRWIKQNNISLYDGETNKGLLRHIYIRQANVTGQIMVCAVANGNKLTAEKSLVDGLCAVDGVKSIILNINKNRTNVILGEECVTLWGSDYIEDELCSLRFKISPLSFYQVNHSQTQKLYAKAKEYADLKGGETLVDLYCGTGTIGLTMAANVKRLIGVEVVEQAVENARENARLNSIDNADFICGDAPKLAKELMKKGIKPDVVIVDPPRKGCGEQLVATVNEMSPERVVYVSCDPATLARDCGIFESFGYKVKKATPVDMFPRTAHVESVVLLTKTHN